MNKRCLGIKYESKTRKLRQASRKQVISGWCLRSCTWDHRGKANLLLKHCAAGRLWHSCHHENVMAWTCTSGVLQWMGRSLIRPVFSSTHPRHRQPSLLYVSHHLSSMTQAQRHPLPMLPSPSSPGPKGQSMHGLQAIVEDETAKSTGGSNYILHDLKVVHWFGFS